MQILFAASCIGTAISQVILATYIYLAALGADLSGYELVPIISFGAMVFIAAFGPVPIPYIIMGEILPDKV